MVACPDDFQRWTLREVDLTPPIVVSASKCHHRVSCSSIETGFQRHHMSKARMSNDSDPYGRAWRSMTRFVFHCRTQASDCWTCTNSLFAWPLWLPLLRFDSQALSRKIAHPTPAFPWMLTFSTEPLKFDRARWVDTRQGGQGSEQTKQRAAQGSLSATCSGVQEQHDSCISQAPKGDKS